MSQQWAHLLHHFDGIMCPFRAESEIVIASYTQMQTIIIDHVNIHSDSLPQFLLSCFLDGCRCLGKSETKI